MDHMDSNQVVDKKHSHYSPEGVQTGDSPDTVDTVDIPDKPDSRPSAVRIPETMTAVAREMGPEMAHTLAFVPAPAAVAREMFPEKVVDIPVLVPGNLERRDRVHSRAETAGLLTDEKAAHPSHARDARTADRQD
jgi:hypothetical protein